MLFDLDRRRGYGTATRHKVATISGSTNAPSAAAATAHLPLCARRATPIWPPWRS